MKIPIVLIGYPGSQKIVKASKYLTSKYLTDFNITYLNYTGEINGWADYVRYFLTFLTDEYVIFALDDYLVADYIDIIKFCEAERKLGGKVVAVKLCHCTQEEHEEYPVTTQYTIWDRERLIWLLANVKTPWEFEMRGSRVFSEFYKSDVVSCLKYFTNSSVSGRWEGVRLDGLKGEDIEYITVNNLI